MAMGGKHNIKMAIGGNHNINEVTTQNGQIDCQSEAKELFEKLHLWREQSHFQFSEIINAHSSSINMGINDLIEKVGAMQKELFTIRKERNVLLETVDNLNIEISAKLPNLESPDKHFEYDVQVFDKSETIPNTTVQGVYRQKIQNEPDHEDASIHNEYNSDQNMEQKHDTYFLDDWDYMDNNAINVNTDACGSNVEDGQLKNYDTQDKVIASNQKKEEGSRICEMSEQDLSGKVVVQNNLYEEDLVCQECSFAFASVADLRIHMTNGHPNIKMVSEEKPRDDGQSKEQNDLSKIELIALQEMKRSFDQKVLEPINKQARDDKLRCEQCPFVTSWRSHLKTHIKSAHYYICEKCHYATSDKGRMKKHIGAVHDKIRNYVCEECDHAASNKQNLEMHINRIHKKIRNHLCEDCDYAACEKYELRNHIKTVHKIGEKEFKCDQCSYSTIHRHHLNRHKGSVHNMGDKEFKCYICPYETNLRQCLKRHMKNVHRIKANNKRAMTL